MRALLVIAALLAMAGCQEEERYVKVVLRDGTTHFAVLSKHCYIPAWCTTFFEVGVKEP